MAGWVQIKTDFFYFHFFDFLLLQLDRIQYPHVVHPPPANVVAASLPDTQRVASLAFSECLRNSTARVIYFLLPHPKETI